MRIGKKGRRESSRGKEGGRRGELLYGSAGRKRRPFDQVRSRRKGEKKKMFLLPLGDFSTGKSFS